MIQLLISYCTTIILTWRLLSSWATYDGCQQCLKDCCVIHRHCCRLPIDLQLWFNPDFSLLEFYIRRNNSVTKHPIAQNNRSNSVLITVKLLLLGRLLIPETAKFTFLYIIFVCTDEYAGWGISHPKCIDFDLAIAYKIKYTIILHLWTCSGYGC